MMPSPGQRFIVLHSESPELTNFIRVTLPVHYTLSIFLASSYPADL